MQYNIHGRTYSSGIHDDAIVIHIHGEGLSPEEENAELYFTESKEFLTGLMLEPTTTNPKRKAEYPQLVHWEDRYFVIHSSKKTDVLIKETPAECLDAYELPVQVRL